MHGSFLYVYDFTKNTTLRALPELFATLERSRALGKARQ